MAPGPASFSWAPSSQGHPTVAPHQPRQRATLALHHSGPFLGGGQCRASRGTDPSGHQVQLGMWRKWRAGSLGLPPSAPRCAHSHPVPPISTAIKDPFFLLPGAWWTSAPRVTVVTLTPPNQHWQVPPAAPAGLRQLCWVRCLRSLPTLNQEVWKGHRSPDTGSHEVPCSQL